MGVFFARDQVIFKGPLCRNSTNGSNKEGQVKWAFPSILRINQVDFNTCDIRPEWTKMQFRIRSR